MGCGASRLKNVTPDSIPARFRPILRRRIEEVQRRRRLGAAKDESSKEELLLAKADDDDVDDQKSEKVRKRGGSVTSSEEERGGEAGAGAKREGADVADLGGEDLTDESNIAFPGSPSFRIYFVDNGEEDDGDDDHHLEIIKEESVKEKLQSGDLDAGIEKKPETKTVVKKRRSLKMAIPKGGQSAVKNLLNVKGCYTPPCGARPDHAHLIAAKSHS